MPTTESPMTTATRMGEQTKRAFLLAGCIYIIMQCCANIFHYARLGDGCWGMLLLEGAPQSAATLMPQIPSGNQSGQDVKTSQDPPQFVFMVTTARRPGNVSYVEECVDALIDGGAKDIVVMNTDLETNPVLSETMATKSVQVLDRPAWLPASDLNIPFTIVHTKFEQPKFDNAARDDQERKAWRSKEALDFVHLSHKMLADYPATPWFIFLQDDAILKEDHRQRFLQTMMALGRKGTIPVSKLNQRGNVAILFHRYYLQSFTPYALLRYDKLPIDWLLANHASEVLGVDNIPVLKLFAHVGVQSTYGKNDSRAIDAVKSRKSQVRGKS